MENGNSIPESKVLVVKMSSLGDLFHALPAVRCLKRGLNATVDWVTQPEYVELVGSFADVRKVIAFPRRGFFSGMKAFAAALRRERYDYVVDLQGLLKSAVVVALARGGRRIGPSFSREGASFFYDAVAGVRNKERHAVEEAMDVVRHLNLPVLAPEFPLSFPKADPEGAAPRVAIIPCSRWSTKNWSTDKFAGVAAALQERAKASVYLFGSAADAEVCGDIARPLMGRATNFAGRTSLVEMGSMLKEMDLVISVDSGPMHMAAALGRPVLAIFGPTEPRRTGPFGDRHRIVCPGALPCRPCFSDVCSQGRRSCMDDVSAAEVADAALSMLGVG